MVISKNKTEKQPMKELEELPHRITLLKRSVAKMKRVRKILKESERMYKALFRSSRDALILQKLTPEIQFIFGNPAAIQLFGCANEEEFRSKTLVDFSPPYQADGTPSLKMAGQMVSIARENGSHSFEFRNKRMDGTEFISNVLLSLMKINGEEVLQATVSDITKENEVEKSLQESEERFRTIFSESPIGILVFDSKGQLLDANGAFSTIFGLTAGNYQSPQSI